MMQPSKHNTQSGSAFFLILIGIFLFAGLSYAIMQSSRTSMSTLSSEQARVAAQEIIAYADTIVKAVQQLRLKGCTEQEISFDSPQQPNWWNNNSSAPADNSCSVFDMNGGKVRYMAMDPLWQITSAPNPIWWVNGQSAVVNIGTPNPELIIWATNLKSEICTQINKIINGQDPVDDDLGVHTTNFDGTYNLIANGIGDDPGSIYAGKSSGCIGEGSDYGFYQVLIAR